MMESASQAHTNGGDTPKAAPARRRSGWVPLILLFLCSAVLGLGGMVVTFWNLPYGSPPFPKEIDIPAGTGLQEVAEILEKKDLLMDHRLFVLVTALLGEQRRIRAGKYRFPAPVAPKTLLAHLVRGDVWLQRATIPEGWTIVQIAERLSEKGLVNRERFIALASASDYASGLLGFKAPSLEGFLFPDTYHFEAGMKEEKILQAMVDAFHQAFDASFRRRAQKLGWSVLEVVTLASLIEKEAAQPEERPLISGVFHQRLDRGMKLQSDPTVIYGLHDFNGNLRRQDLAAPHPYNTYSVTGLPPGPICNPGLASIKAALFPADRGYLYFVSRNDGSHHFSRTLKEHQRAVRKYQKKR
jgi:UPF0755 protein